MAERIARYDIDRIELADVGEIDPGLLGAVLAAKRPVDLLFSDLRWLQYPWSADIGACRAKSLAAGCNGCEAGVETPSSAASVSPEKQRSLKLALASAEAVISTDRLSAAFADRVFAGRQIRCDAPAADRMTPSEANAAARPCLAILAPILSPQVDRLLQAIGRANARNPAGAAIVVIGACIDDLAAMAAGGVHVCGPTPPADYERLIAQYEVGFVFSPYRTGNFWLLDDLSSAVQLRRAYFDWSFGAMPPDSTDLAMDPRTCDARAAALLLAWWTEASTSAVAPGRPPS
jgi:hypothetical protein